MYEQIQQQTLPKYVPILVSPWNSQTVPNLRLLAFYSSVLTSKRIDFLQHALPVWVQGSQEEETHSPYSSRQF